MSGFLNWLCDRQPKLTYHAVYYVPSNGNDDEAWDRVNGPEFDNPQAALFWYRTRARSTAFATGSLIGIQSSEGVWFDID
ncbi:MAG: hypothetical protein UZ22_OP11002000149 [Microgenomates bacterium OLB23]|nr:MAG: hypothetical protein UZ22_OP11002000149 [Microgenomates bacterium OLB23]